MFNMEIKKWWKEAIGYQIYPRSFLDTNNDGIGDIRGIISKLDYLKDLGITMIWLCPVYKSPMDDNGYDVSDFYDIAEDYGTLDDILELIDELHKRDMRLIMDLVLNHTSDEHNWFLEARKSKDNPYRDFYIWADGKINEKGEMVEPNNLASFFSGSCWKYDEVAKQYYMKIFSDKMPDLNWSNPKLREKMFEMAKWWLDKGVDGFRVDAVAHLSRDMSFVDSDMEHFEKYKPDWKFFSNRPELHDYLKEFNEKVFSKYDCMTVGEAGGGATPRQALDYSGYDSHELNMTFTFDHCWENGAFGADTKKDEEIKTNVISLKDVITKWQLGLYGKGWNPIYWLNHDHPRVASQYGDINYHKESCKMLCNTLYMLWGTPFVYNGEEIGMTNVDYTSLDQFKDVSAQNYAKFTLEDGRLTLDQILVHLRRSSRINSRTPMQWNDKEYAGFSTVKPWVDNVGNYKVINVESQLEDSDSILNHYKKILHLRKEGEYKDLIIYGNYELLDRENDKIFSYKRELNNQKILVISNFFKEEGVVNFEQFKVKKVIDNNYHNYDLNCLVNLTLRPFESYILEIE